ncbi:uncharacterized protein DUF1206 [Kribbella orskensis]|uniref:Uncharacterized protein DUF1206 n=1 Tax=Kribbella orskensis TaxID=2512216 RepID=A0ABY2BV62_9ACTN|nr:MULTISPECIES: DUF1206 domain-containing protein [Kribbella]TCN44282.1 uncharacterized protein DUF1206 [Kribbella sp. VKM Ac-2500]TCO31940.1 uncharacterized protein DUF1206 [Kribbella orskensis]
MRTAEEAQQSRVYDYAITVGLIAYGVVYLLIAWIALQVAWSNSSEEASQQGALKELASKPFGEGLLWIVAIGLFVLVIWKVLELVYGHLNTEKKVSSIGRGIVYLALGVSAVKVAMGSSQSGTSQSSGMTAKLMENGAGRVLVVIGGLVLVGVGVRQIYKSVTKKFLEDLTGGVSRPTVMLGRAGYAAKGVAFITMGVLFAWASISYDPKKAGGLDTAMRTLKDQPFGDVLLTLVALGLACFGVYCFVWSRNAKH